MNSTAPPSLLDRQLAAVRAMLRLNTSAAAAAPNNGAAAGPHRDAVREPHWKVLLFDAPGQDILSPILSVKQLREEGVTLYLNLKTERDPVPDVPAVYFCQPTDENLKRIAQDLHNGLYGQYYFNFISPISRQKLEDLASAALQANAVAQVEKLFDQYVNFICLEPEMFTLRHTREEVSGHTKSAALSYYALNQTGMTDTDMEEIISQVVDGLFAVCVTLGTIPVLRCPKGNAAEQVAIQLDKKLRENHRDTRNSLFGADGLQAGQYSFYRPLLVILDRHVDMATPLHHTWTYQALAHDVLKYRLNRVSITEDGTDKARTCDLDRGDQFWVGHKGSPFPQVAEKIQEELEVYRSKEEEIKKMGKKMGLGDGGSESDAAVVGGLLTDNMQKMTSAVSSLPALIEKKRLIDMHTSLATAMLTQIKHRKLDLFFELEEKILSRQALDRPLMEIIQDAEAGTPEDKMRLFIIYFLCSPQTITDAEMTEYTQALKDMGCDLKPLDYLKRWRSMSAAALGDPTAAAAAAADFTGAGTKTVSMFRNLIGQSSTFIMEGVKNLVVKKHNLPVTKIVEELMDLRPGGQCHDGYRYFDPKILKAAENIPRAKTPFQEAIVFVIGGGNYIEYQNLVDFVTPGGGGGAALAAGAGQTNSKRIIYGCSTLNNAHEMMQDLAKLGHEM